MTSTFTPIDSAYDSSSRLANGNRRIWGTVSVTNPYSTGGDSFSVSTFFKEKFFGGHVGAVNPSVSVGNAGIARTGTFRGDSNSYTTAVLQFFNNALTVNGQFVDNTVANLSGTTLQVVIEGR